MRAWVDNGVLTSQLLDSVPVSVESPIIHDLFSLHLSLSLPLEFVLLLFLLLPLFVSDTSHNPLVGLSLLLPIFLVLLLLVPELLLDRLISLLQQGLLQPLLEHSISCILLSMLAESFELLLLVLLIAAAFLFKAFLVLPLHHTVMFFLATDLLSGLSLADLLKNVTLFFSYKLFFQLSLVLLATHPLFMGDGSGTTLSNLATLLHRAMIHGGVLAA